MTMSTSSRRNNVIFIYLPFSVQEPYKSREKLPKSCYLLFQSFAVPRFFQTQYPIVRSETRTSRLLKWIASNIHLDTSEAVLFRQLSVDATRSEGALNESALVLLPDRGKKSLPSKKSRKEGASVFFACTRVHSRALACTCVHQRARGVH